MKLQTTICYKNLKKVSLTIDLGNPNSATNCTITFHLCSYSKLVSPIIFTFHQNKALKKLWKMLFVSPKLFFWFLQYSNFRRKLRIEKQITITSWYRLRKSPTLILEKSKNLFKLRDQKWSDDELLKKKLLNIYGNILKLVLGTFRDFVRKQKTNL